MWDSGVPGGGGGNSTTTTPPKKKIPKFYKVELDCKLSRKCLVFLFQHLISLKIAEFRTPTPQDVWKECSKILKLPVRNCFTSAMTNKFVVIINSIKYQKLRKFYYMKWNFLYHSTAASRTPDYGGYSPQIPVRSVLCPQLNLLNPPPQKKNSWVRQWCERYLLLNKN
jgi:hypothetical protein